MSQFDQNHAIQPRTATLCLSIRLGVLLILVSLSSACSRPPDEQQIHEAIEQIRDAIENRQSRAVLEHLSEDFKAQQTKTNRDIRGMMLFYFRQNRNISVYLTDESIRVTGTRADVTINALVTGAENLLPQRAQTYAVRMRWNKQDGDWQLSLLDWELLPLLQN